MLAKFIVSVLALKAAIIYSIISPFHKKFFYITILIKGNKCYFLEGGKMIYLDNGATTRKKPYSVVSALFDGATKYSANPGRSGHRASLECAMKIASTRQTLQEYFGVSRLENVIFTSGCTESLNLAILGTARQGGHVITTAFEHNSTLRPLFELERKGVIELTIVEPKNKDKITLDDIKSCIKPNTYMICTIHISNVDGAESDIDSIGKFCKENEYLYLVDAAQSAGHKRINMQKQNINFLTLAGHKGLFGCQGVGALLIEGDTLPSPIKFGGTGTESISVYQPHEPPECYESGTIATPNILSLNAGVKFVKEHQNEIFEKMKKQTKMLLNELKKLNHIKIYTDFSNLNGVVSFNIDNIDSTEVAEYLSENFDICVRGGLHCAPLKHKFLGTQGQGTVRVSLSYFTTDKEIKMLINALKTYIKLIEANFA